MRSCLLQAPLRLCRDFVDYPCHCDLGVVQAAAVLGSEGSAQVVDAFAMPASDVRLQPDGHVVLGAPVEDVIAAVDRPDVIVVGYTPFHCPPRRDELLAELLAGLRRRFPRCPLVLADLYQGGQHYVEAQAEAVLASYPEVDILLKYEAETALPALCSTLAVEGRPATSRVLLGSPPVDLDALPLPAWDLVGLPARDRLLATVERVLGRARWSYPVDGRTLPAVTSRGCPYRCLHCSSNPGLAPGQPKSQRRHGEAHVRRLVDELVRRHGATRIAVLDEMVNASERHLDAVIVALRGHDILFDFPNGLRADALTPRQVGLMAGRVSTLSVSAESGVQRVVDEVVGKRLDLSSIERVAGWAQAAGVPALVHYMIGLPGETRADVQATLEHALRLHEESGAWPAVQYATPLPGTRLRAEAERAGPLPPVDDFGPLFQHRPVTSGRDFGPEELRVFKDTFDQRLAAGQGPRKLIVNVTYRCNNHCAFCAVGNRGRSDGDLETQQAVLVEYHGKGVRMVDFDGGEPTLHPDLVRLVRFARRLGYERVSVTTNGRRCAYEGFARRLTHCGLTTLLFSLHGPDPSTHGQLVGVPEAFGQTCSGIRNCVRLAPPAVEMGLNVTVTRLNHDRLDEMALLAWDLGLRWVNLQFLTPFGRATRGVSPDLPVAARLASGVLDRWRDRMRFQVINLPFCLMPGHEDLLAGDLLKLERHMHFVDDERVNLFEYLRQRRKHTDACQGCPRRIFCGGFYDLANAPDPPWEPARPEGGAERLRRSPRRHFARVARKP